MAFTVCPSMFISNSRILVIAIYSLFFSNICNCKQNDGENGLLLKERRTFAARISGLEREERMRGREGKRRERERDEKTRRGEDREREPNRI